MKLIRWDRIATLCENDYNGTAQVRKKTIFGIWTKFISYEYLFQYVLTLYVREMNEFKDHTHISF